MKRVLHNWHFWFAIAIIIAGIGVLAFGIYYVNNSKAKRGNYIEISAVVVDYYESSTADEEPLYAEIVEYTFNGVTYRTKNSMSSSAPKRIGTEMRIAINPNNPKDCIFPASEKLLKIVLFVLGGALTFFGAVFAVRLVKNSKVN